MALQKMLDDLTLKLFFSYWKRFSHR